MQAGRTPPAACCRTRKTNVACRSLLKRLRRRKRQKKHPAACRKAQRYPPACRKEQKTNAAPKAKIRLRRPVAVIFDLLRGKDDDCGVQDDNFGQVCVWASFAAVYPGTEFFSPQALIFIENYDRKRPPQDLRRAFSIKFFNEKRNSAGEWKTRTDKRSRRKVLRQSAHL